MPFRVPTKQALRMPVSGACKSRAAQRLARSQQLEPKQPKRHREAWDPTPPQQTRGLQKQSVWLGRPCHAARAPWQYIQPIPQPHRHEGAQERRGCKWTAACCAALVWEGGAFCGSGAFGGRAL